MDVAVRRTGKRWAASYNQDAGFPCAFPRRIKDQFQPLPTPVRVSTPFLITSADLATGGVHVFKSGYFAIWASPTRGMVR